jgi:hypothetical protein
VGSVENMWIDALHDLSAGAEDFCLRGQVTRRLERGWQELQAVLNDFKADVAFYPQGTHQFRYPLLTFLLSRRPVLRQSTRRQPSRRPR